MKVMMFGSEADIEVKTVGNRVTQVKCIKANARCERLIKSVNAQLETGRDLHDQYHNMVALIDLTMALLTVQDEAAAAVRVAA